MRYTIDKHVAWLCVAGTFAAGMVWGFLVGVLVLA